MVTRMRSVGSARRLGAGLILLALWLQLLAPAAGVLTRVRQAEAAAADALIHAILCGRDQGPDGAADLHAGLHADTPADHAACDRCPLCRCTAAAPLPVLPDAVAGRLVWRRVTWPIPPPIPDIRPARNAVQARAPPETV